MRGRRISILQLQRELSAKKAKLRRIRTKRRKLASQIAALDRQAESLAGGPAPAGERAKKAKRKRITKRAKAAKKSRSTKGRKRAKRRATRKPLAGYVDQVLAGAAKGMKIKDVASAVVKAGYRTKSKNFYGIVAAALRENKKYKRVGRGVYRLQG